MSEIDEIVQRTIDTVTLVADKAARFSGRLFIGAAIICVGSFLLGIAALSGGIQTVWIVLGFVFGLIAVGGSFLARWRVGSIKRHVPELAEEVRTLITQGKDSTKTIIDTVVIDDGVSAGNAIVLSKQMYGFKNLAGSSLEASARLTAALSAITSFPGLVFAAIGITLVFGFLGGIFLIALAL